jgi:hypothetical protein
MTLFDFLDRVAFLRGETAALLLVATAVAIFILPDVRLGLFALAAHYFAAALLFVEVLDPRLAIVKLLTGWFVCLMLYLTGRQVNWGRPPADLTPEEADAWPSPPLGLKWGRPDGAAPRSWRQVAGAFGPVAGPLALAAAGLAAIWFLTSRPALSLPALPETLAYFNLAVYALVGFGLLHMGRGARPLTAGMGAFLFLSGFELFYSFLDQTVIGLGLLAALNLTLALTIGYLTQAHYALPSPPPPGWQWRGRITAVAGLLLLGLLGWRLNAEMATAEAALFWLLASLAAFYLFSLLWPPGGGLIPLTLAAAALLALALLVETPAWGGLLLIMGALLLAAAGQGGARGDVGPGWRYLVLTLLALPFLLLAGWQAGLPTAFPLSSAALLAGAAILLLGGFPASLWVRPLARRAPPLLWPFLFGGAHLAIVAYLFGWLAAQPAWTADAAWRIWLTWGGVAAALFGGVLAALSADEEELLPSLLLLDMGVALLLLLLPGDGGGWETAVAFYRARIIGLLLLAVGWGIREPYSVSREPYSVAVSRIPYSVYGPRTTGYGPRLCFSGAMAR